MFVHLWILCCGQRTSSTLPRTGTLLPPESPPPSPNSRPRRAADQANGAGLPYSFPIKEASQHSVGYEGRDREDKGHARAMQAALEGGAPDNDEDEPTAWPPHPPSLRLFDAALRCPICFDFFDVPKALTCGHSCAPPTSPTPHGPYSRVRPH
jgi:hypothetical protein